MNTNWILAGVIVVGIVVLVTPFILQPSSHQERGEDYEQIREAIRHQEPKKMERLLERGHLHPENASYELQFLMRYKQWLRQIVCSERVNYLDREGYLDTPPEERPDGVNKDLAQVLSRSSEYNPRKRAEMLDLLLRKGKNEYQEANSRVNWGELGDLVRLMENPPHTVQMDGYDMGPVREVLARYRPR